MKYDSFRVFTVQIDLMYEEDFESIAASMSEQDRVKFVKSVSPVEDYDDCVDKLERFLIADGFTIDKQYDSPSPGSLSRYIFCHRTSDETDKTIACEFNLRVSDHKLEGSGYRKRRRNRFNKSTKPEIEKNTGKQVLDAVYPNIRYNNKIYTSYDSFLEKVTKDIHNWSNLYGK